MTNTTTSTTTKFFQTGDQVTDSLGTGIAGTVEYRTEDGWLGVRDAEGRLDELPEARATAQ